MQKADNSLNASKKLNTTSSGTRKLTIKKVLLNIDDILASILVSVLILMTVTGVFMRYVLNNPLKWTEEASLALFVWFTLLGASSAMKKKLHISIDFFVEMLPEKFQKYVGFLVTIINFVVLSIIGILGYQLTLQASLKITPVLRVPYTYIYSAVPVGCVLMIISLALRVKDEIRQGKNNSNKGKEV